MKKTVTAVLGFVLLFFVGCNSGQTPPDLPSDFVCTLTVEYNDMELQGTFSHTPIGQDGFQMISPEWLSGFALFRDKGDVTLSFGDLSVNREGLLPDTAWFMKLTAVLEHLAGNCETVLDYYDKQVMVYSGNCKAGDYKIVFDAKTKNPVSLHIGDGIQITFYDIRSN